MATPPEVSEDGYSLVCSLSELQGLGRKRVKLNERVVVLFHVKEKVYALDHFCYRKRITHTQTLYPLTVCLCVVGRGLRMSSSSHMHIMGMVLTPMSKRVCAYLKVYYLYPPIDTGGPLDQGDIEVSYVTITLYNNKTCIC